MSPGYGRKRDDGSVNPVWRVFVESGAQSSWEDAPVDSEGNRIATTHSDLENAVGFVSDEELTDTEEEDEEVPESEYEAVLRTLREGQEGQPQEGPRPNWSPEEIDALHDQASAAQQQAAVLPISEEPQDVPTPEEPLDDSMMLPEMTEMTERDPSDPTFPPYEGEFEDEDTPMEDGE